MISFSIQTIVGATSVSYMVSVEIGIYSEVYSDTLPSCSAVLICLDGETIYPEKDDQSWVCIGGTCNGAHIFSID